MNNCDVRRILCQWCDDNKINRHYVKFNFNRRDMHLMLMSDRCGYVIGPMGKTIEDLKTRLPNVEIELWEEHKLYI